MTYEPQGLLEAALADQAHLTAVERFAQRHEGGAESLGSQIYEDLVTLPDALGAGQQLAFRVDLDACTGCKACVTACHSLNGLEADEAWRAVGEMSCGEGPTATIQTVTTACHHCADPACLRGCPAQAYEKEEATGVVVHLDDACIGCQYCLLECPYDAPKYRPDLGIVRKCDMCLGRLAQGEAPACVQGCPTGAISIEAVDVRREAPPLLPLETGAMADARLTRPTTQYVGTRSNRVFVAADAVDLRPASGHDPLAVMLVLMQLSFGLLVADTLAGGSWLGRFIAATAAAAGLLAALAHLGRPTRAYRAILGWRTSWMSREVVCFGGYAAALGAAVASPAVGLDTGALFGAVALLSGALGTACSVMIYVDTGRPYWSASRTTARFLGTAVILGLASTAVLQHVWGGGGWVGVVAALAALAGLGKLAFEAWDAGDVRDRSPVLERSALLLRGPLREDHRRRFVVGTVGVAALVAAAFSSSMVLGIVGFFGVFVGELLERRLFFRAEAQPGMPGV